MAATRDQRIAQRLPGMAGHSYGYPPKNGVCIFKRAIVAVNASLQAIPAGTTGAVAIVGLASEQVDNSQGKAADRKVIADKGVFNMPLPAATPANIGAAVYAVDDATLSLDGAGGKLKAGTIDAIDAEGVWVKI